MQRRQDEARQTMLLHEVEEMTGCPFPESFKKAYRQGADEIDLVRSGLDDTMRTAYQAIRHEWHANEKCHDLRTAAYIVAIQRISQSYSCLNL